MYYWLLGSTDWKYISITKQTQKVLSLGPQNGFQIARWPIEEHGRNYYCILCWFSTIYIMKEMQEREFSDRWWLIGRDIYYGCWPQRQNNLKMHITCSFLQTSTSRHWKEIQNLTCVNWNKLCILPLKGDIFLKYIENQLVGSPCSVYVRENKGYGYLVMPGWRVLWTGKSHFFANQHKQTLNSNTKIDKCQLK